MESESRTSNKFHLFSSFLCLLVFLIQVSCITKKVSRLRDDPDISQPDQSVEPGYKAGEVLQGYNLSGLVPDGIVFREELVQGNKILIAMLTIADIDYLKWKACRPSSEDCIEGKSAYPRTFIVDLPEGDYEVVAKICHSNDRAQGNPCSEWSNIYRYRQTVRENVDAYATMVALQKVEQEFTNLGGQLDATLQQTIGAMSTCQEKDQNYVAALNALRMQGVYGLAYQLNVANLDIFLSQFQLTVGEKEEKAVFEAKQEVEWYTGRARDSFDGLWDARNKHKASDSVGDDQLKQVRHVVAKEVEGIKNGLTDIKTHAELSGLGKGDRKTALTNAVGLSDRLAKMKLENLDKVSTAKIQQEIKNIDKLLANDLTEKAYKKRRGNLWEWNWTNSREYKVGEDLRAAREKLVALQEIYPKAVEFNESTKLLNTAKLTLEARNLDYQKVMKENMQLVVNKRGIGQLDVGSGRLSQKMLPEDSRRLTSVFTSPEIPVFQRLNILGAYSATLPGMPDRQPFRSVFANTITGNLMVMDIDVNGKATLVMGQMEPSQKAITNGVLEVKKSPIIDFSGQSRTKFAPTLDEWGKLFSNFPKEVQVELFKSMGINGGSRASIPLNVDGTVKGLVFKVERPDSISRMLAGIMQQEPIVPSREVTFKRSDLVTPSGTLKALPGPNGKKAVLLPGISNVEVDSRPINTTTQVVTKQHVDELDVPLSEQRVNKLDAPLSEQRVGELEVSFTKQPNLDNPKVSNLTKGLLTAAGVGIAGVAGFFIYKAVENSSAQLASGCFQKESDDFRFKLENIVRQAVELQGSHRYLREKLAVDYFNSLDN